MKRAIALHAGVLGLSAFFASAASANTCFSTGPLENDASNHSDKFRVVVLNNQNKQSGSLTATVLVHRLNGTKDTAFFDTFTVGPRASDSIERDTSEFSRLEIQVKLDGLGRDDTLLGVFGLSDTNGPPDTPPALNPSHRLVHTELAKISCDLVECVGPFDRCLAPEPQQ